MAAAGPKRSFFKKPAWGSSGAARPVQDDASHNRIYDEILEARRQERENEAAKIKVRAEKADPSREKKRRQPSEENEDREGSKRSRTTTPERADVLASEEDDDVRPVTRSTPVKKRRSTEKATSRSPKTKANKKESRPAQSEVIDLGDDDDDDDGLPASPIVRVATKSTPAKPKSQYADPLSDDDEGESDFTRELTRKARERARLQKLGIDVGKPSAATPPATGGLGSFASSHKSASPQDAPNSTPGASPAIPPADDPNVQIHIKTRIPDTKGLIINQPASRSLKLAKELWCNRQQFDAAKTAKIFLTWRGAKLWNSSTMKLILEQLKKERPDEIFIVPTDGEEQPQQGIELEAMTQEIFEEYQHERKRKELAAAAAAAAGGPPPTADDDAADPTIPDTDDATAPAKPHDDRIVIQLVCAALTGVAPMGLRVRPTSLVSKIMASFKHTQPVEPGKTCWLVFDGERLDPEMTVAEVGFEDQDVVEVLLR